MKKNISSYYSKRERRVLIGMAAIVCVSATLVYLLGSNTNTAEAEVETDTAYVYVKDTVYYKSAKKYSKREYFKKRDYVEREEKAGRPYYERKEADTTRWYTGKIRKGEHITLNVADTTQLMKVPGIGSYYSKQIVRYGERLGGYVSTDQIDEINIPEEVKEYLDVDTSGIRKLNVNTLTLEQLRRHPYINYYVARSIVDYRKRYGRINDIDDLRLDPNLPDDLRNRIRPYMEY